MNEQCKNGVRQETLHIRLHQTWQRAQFIKEGSKQLSKASVPKLYCGFPKALETNFLDTGPQTEPNGRPPKHAVQFKSQESKEHLPYQ